MPVFGIATGIECPGGFWPLMLLLWGALIGFGVWAVRRFTEVPSDAERILAERFARGEIDADEFERLRSALTSRTPAVLSRPRGVHS